MSDNGGYPTPGGYYSPNRNLITKPSLSTAQTPVLRYDIQTGEFKLVMFQVTFIEAGSSARFMCYFEHIVDGPIPFTNPPNDTSFVAPTLTIKDQNGSTVGSGSAGVTVNSVQADPALLGNFYSAVEFGANLIAGYYESEWVAQYQPQPVRGVAQVELPIKVRRPFMVQYTVKPSQFFLVSTKRI